MSDLFNNSRPECEEIYPDMFLLTDFTPIEPISKQANLIIKLSPFRRMMTPMGHYTGIEITNCGEYGWTSDLNGYQYSTIDPVTRKNWPLMPEEFLQLANRAAKTVGYDNFIPDSCLINQYKIGTSLGTHQDKDEKDYQWPIVSLSIGLTATFQVSGAKRTGNSTAFQLHQGDVLVWGNSARLAYHGVKKLKPDTLNPRLDKRINLTFRKAG